MTSTSSKTLPFLSLAIGFVAMVLAVFGYADQVSKVAGFLAIVLPITASGGLINKAVEKGFAKGAELANDPAFAEVIKKIVVEVKTAQAESAKPASTN